MKFAVLGCLAIVLCGCVAKPFVINNPSRYAAPGSDFDGRATVYVMRDLSGVGIKWPVHVQLDGVDQGLSLRRASYTRFAVTPGRHVINAHWNHLLSARPDVAVSSDFEAGKTYYFDIGTDNKLSFMGVEYDSLMHPLEPKAGAKLVHTYNDRSSVATSKRHG